MSKDTFTVVIVDDEKPARERLKRILGELNGFAYSGEASQGIEALELCAQQLPDVVLLDIRMPGMDGIEAARHLSELESPPAVIFTTAYNEYAIEAFDAQAIAYLMKPVRKQKLERALNHASRLNGKQIQQITENSETARTHLSARIGDRLRLIPWAEVLYFQADQKYVSVGLADDEVLIDDSLKSLETEFGDKVFRIHRNALVVLNHLRALEKQSDGSMQVIIKNSEKKLSVSRRHISALRKLIKSRK